MRVVKYFSSTLVVAALAVVIASAWHDTWVAPDRALFEGLDAAKIRGGQYLCYDELPPNHDCPASVHGGPCNEKSGPDWCIGSEEIGYICKADKGGSWHREMYADACAAAVEGWTMCGVHIIDCNKYEKCKTECERDDELVYWCKVNPTVLEVGGRDASERYPSGSNDCYSGS